MRVFDASLPAKVLLGIRLRFELAKVRHKRRRQIRAVVLDALPAGDHCSVCGSGKTVRVSFERPEGLINKSLCLQCEHLYSSFLQTDPLEADEIFQFGAENEAKSTQVQLLTEAVERSEVTRGLFLDFGVGGNISAFGEAQRLLPGHRFNGCDVYRADVPGYFQTYDPAAPLGMFDGISSYAVVEHLTGTLESWRTFNRLLKPVSEGGGIMIHAFPSQLHHDLDHWAIQIHTHACIFSRQSLRIACRKTGFRVVKADPPRPAGPHYHPILVFRKVRDV